MRGRTPPRQRRKSGRAHGQSSTQRRGGGAGGGGGGGAQGSQPTRAAAARTAFLLPPPSTPPTRQQSPLSSPHPTTPPTWYPALPKTHPRTKRKAPTRTGIAPRPQQAELPVTAAVIAGSRPPSRPESQDPPPLPRVLQSGRVCGAPPPFSPRFLPPPPTAPHDRKRRLGERGARPTKKKKKVERTTSLSSCGGDTRRGHGVPPARPGTASTSPCLWGGRRHATSQEEGEEQGADRAGRGRPVGMSRQTAPQPRGEAGTGDMNGREDEHGREGGGEWITKEEGTWLPAAWR